VNDDDIFRLMSAEAADRVVFVVCIILLVLMPWSERFFEAIK
jgi:hypothetical protein